MSGAKSYPRSRRPTNKKLSGLSQNGDKNWTCCLRLKIVVIVLWACVLRMSRLSCRESSPEAHPFQCPFDRNAGMLIVNLSFFLWSDLVCLQTIASTAQQHGKQKSCRNLAMWHNLWLHFGADGHPFATYFDVHQGYRVLTHNHLAVGEKWIPKTEPCFFGTQD